MRGAESKPAGWCRRCDAAGLEVTLLAQESYSQTLTPPLAHLSSVFKLRQKIVDGERPSLAVQEITPEQQDFIELTQRVGRA